MCQQAGAIATSGVVQRHTFHELGDADWVSFEATAGREYLIEALTPADSPADVVLELRDDQGVLTVWAQIYNPSYAPPDNSAEEMPLETLPTILLQDQNQDGTYEGLYDKIMLLLLRLKIYCHKEGDIQ